MTNLPATTEKKTLTLRERIENAGPEFKKALPGHIPVEKFIRTVQTAITMTPGLSEACDKPAGIQSLMTACTKAATDGLILDGREAALVTFNTKVKGEGGKDEWIKAVQYIPMVAGLMKKARNSGDISTIDAIIVHKNDDFSYNPATDDAPNHQPDWFGERGDPVGVYAVVKLKDGTTQVEVMSRQQVLAIGAQSKNPGQYDPASGKNYGEWWRKTVIRRISKYLPSSSDKDEFMQAVSRVDEGFEFEATNGGPTEPVKPTTKKRGAGAAALKDVTPTVKEPPAATQQAREEYARQEMPLTQDNRPYDPETGEVYDHQPDDSAPQPGDDI